MLVQRRHAEQLLIELGVTEPQDIDVEAIAAFCGAFVVFENLTGADARIVGNNNKAFITVSATATIPRQRFSIGHELGHWMWDRGKMALSCTSEIQDRRWNGTDKESIANRFSAELLMPSFMFRPRVERSEPTVATVKSLAGQFQASITATAIRLVESEAYPCMVVAHSSDGREWFRASKDLDGRFWPVKVLDEHSFAHDLIKGGKSASASGLVEADTWIDHPRASWYEIFESSILVSSHLVLSLLWWKDEKMIEDLLEGS